METSITQKNLKQKSKNNKIKQSGHTSFPVVVTFVFIFIFIPYIAKVHAWIFGDPKKDCACYETQVADADSYNDELDESLE